MDVVGVADVRAKPAHAVADLVGIQAPGQKPPRGQNPPGARARALEPLHLVAPRDQERGDVLDRALLASERPVAVVQ